MGGRESEASERLRVLKVDLQKENAFETFCVGLEGHCFQVDRTNENKFYFIKENVVYVQEILRQENEEGFGNVIKNSLNFFISKEKSEEGDALFGAEEFFRAKADLKFLLFERDMRHFFCDDGKNIKRYQADNREVVNVYDEVVFNPSGMLLSPDESLFFRWAPRR